MIITLCGSAKFARDFLLWDKLLSVAGHCVFNLAVNPLNEADDKDWYTPEIKRRLDEVHLDKIASSDAIFVINRFGYIGQSTLNEIAHARLIKRELYACEIWPMNYSPTNICSLNREQSMLEHGVPLDYKTPIGTLERDGFGYWYSERLFKRHNDLTSWCFKRMDEFYKPVSR